MGHRGGSGDWKNYRTAVQQPSYRELRDGGSVAFRDFVQLAAGAREHASCEREPGDEGNIVPFAVFESIFMLSVADVVYRFLNADDLDDFAGAIDVLWLHFAEADVADFALLL